METIDVSEAVIESELCLGHVRWVPLSMLQGHRRKLQQLFQVRTYKNGRPHGVREEWRDVPFVEGE